jgi:hypothetical protein
MIERRTTSTFHPGQLLAITLACLALGTGCIRQFLLPPTAEITTPFLAPAIAETATQVPTTAPTATPAPDLPTPVIPTATPELFGGALNANPSLPRSRYEFSADFDYEKHELVVFQSLTYINRTEIPLDTMVLVVEPNLQEGVFRLKALNWVSGEPVGDYILEGGILEIPLPEPLRPWTSLTLNLEFTLQLPAGPGTLGYTARQTNLGDWYPYVPLYQPGRGWLAHEPSASGVGEYLTYDSADFQVEIQLLDPPDNLVLASSSPGVLDGNWWRAEATAARNFTWSASPDYLVLTDTSGFVTATSYVFPEHRAAGEAVLATTVDALKFFADTFGPLTRTSLSIVEAEFPDGMEYDGLYFLGSSYYSTYFGGPQNFLTTLGIHETSHQWWYGLVANDQAMEPWLDEALATYSELLFFEAFYPDLVEWWWEFRVGLYAPEGYLDTTIYDYDGFRPYVNATYLRGALFLQALRETIGEEAFMNTLQSLVNRTSYHQLTTTSFMELVAENSSADISPLIEEYFQQDPTQ